MRLPADATLAVVGGGAQDGPVGAQVAALIAAWRAEGLPILRVGPTGPHAEATIDPFIEEALKEALDTFGATAIVLCGDGQALAWTAAAAADLGCHVFVPADACGPEDLEPIRLVEASSRGDRARLTDAAAVLAAAALAKARQRRLCR